MKRAIEFKETVEIRHRVVVDASKDEIDAICDHAADSFGEILEYINEETNANILNAEENCFTEETGDFEYYDDYWTGQEEKRFGGN